jgi:uncharacterized protein (TIGR00255 family)
MIRSMTGFARRERQLEVGLLGWELRSVNHRFLEPRFRLPEELRVFENEFRALLGARIARGKIDCVLRFERSTSSAETLRIDRDLARQVAAAATDVGEFVDRPAPVDPLDVLAWPGVVQSEALDLAPLVTAAKAGFEEALDELIAMREREGKRLANLLQARCAAIEQLAATVRARVPEIHARLREKLLARLAEAGVEADHNRLEQELVLLAQKLDIAEELDRLGSHVTATRAALGRREAVGRRLDFLMQELNREANTLGSKSQDSATTQAAVELKVLIEQMREQVQNVE